MDMSLLLEKELSLATWSRNMSLACSLFIHRGGTINGMVHQKQHYSLDLPQGELEIPCCSKVSGQAKENEEVVMCSVSL